MKFTKPADNQKHPACPLITLVGILKLTNIEFHIFCSGIVYTKLYEVSG